MKAILPIIVILLCCFYLPAQVVNTEKLRLDNFEKSFVGDIDLSFGLSQNKAGQTLRFNALTRFEILKPRTHWLLLSGYGLTQFKKVDEPGTAPKTFSNNGFSHLRFGRKLSPFLVWEAFAQGQFDEVQEVEVRLLTGTGPRFKLLRTDTSHLYIGLLYMYEYEKNSIEVTINEPDDFQFLDFERNHRLSTYISGAATIKGYLGINHVSYYQPKLSNWSDFRISSETTLTIKLTNRVALKTYFQFIYDTRPPDTVPQTMFNLTNGLSVSL